MRSPNKITKKIKNSFVDAGNAYCAVGYSIVLILTKTEPLRNLRSKTNQSKKLKTLFWTQVLRSEIEKRANNDMVLIAGKNFHESFLSSFNTVN